MFNITYLHCLLEYVDFSWDYVFQYRLLGFIAQGVLKKKLVMIFFSSHNIKLVYNFATFSLNKHVQGSGVVHLTVLAPLRHKCRSLE